MEQQQQQQQHRFVEVLGLDGKTHRFASGSRAGFAVDRINCKPAAAPHHRLPRVACIQARNDGEEPVDFGPDALLVHYGDGWTLHAIAGSSFSVSWRQIATRRESAVHLGICGQDCAVFPVHASAGFDAQMASRMATQFTVKRSSSG